jgi:hypothetical protein
LLQRITLPFNFAFEYAIRKGLENQVGLRLNGTNQFLAYAGDVNLLGDNIHTMNKSTGSLTDARKEAGRKCRKILYKLLSHHKNAGQNQDIKIANR